MLTFGNAGFADDKRFTVIDQWLIKHGFESVPRLMGVDYETSELFVAYTRGTPSRPQQARYLFIRFLQNSSNLTITLWLARPDFPKVGRRRPLMKQAANQVPLQITNGLDPLRLEGSSRINLVEPDSLQKFAGTIQKWFGVDMAADYGSP